MAKEEKEYVYYERNVRYPVAVRMKLFDPQAFLLTDQMPFVEVDVENLRVFKMANKRVIEDGSIRPTPEPNLDWETPNTITDEEVTQYLKNFMKLKAKIADVNSVAILHKFLNAAKTQNKSDAVIELIQNRLDEVDEKVLDPTQMRGVE